jgi:hypothetical protein
MKRVPSPPVVICDCGGEIRLSWEAPGGSFFKCFKCNKRYPNYSEKGENDGEGKNDSGRCPGIEG